MKKLFALLLFGCAQAVNAQLFVAEFNPSPAQGQEAKLPSAINLAFFGSTDGTLNAPVSDPATAPLVEAVNALDGFSTVAPVTTTFSAPVAADTVVPGATVRVFEVGLVSPIEGLPTVTGVQRELTAGVDFTATLADPQTLAVIPLRPLKPKTGHMVVLTDGIRSVDGAPPLPDFTYILARYRKGPLVDGRNRSLFRRLSDAQAQQLEPLRRIVVSQEDAAAAAGVHRPGIVFSWTFLTQSIGDVLAAVKSQASPQPIGAVATGASTSQFAPGLPGLADIYAGSLQVPYYLEAPTAVPAVILSTHWSGVNDRPVTRYEPNPIATQNLTIPLLASVPNSTDTPKPATGWPVVIFQHGITRNRGDLILVADALAAAGLAAVAIDLPLHGVTDTANPLYREGQERTFNADLLNNTSGAPGADGMIDESGSHFINLTSLLTARDNLRQGVADLLHLLVSLPNLDLDSDGTPDLDTTRVKFLGNSLGGIVGGVFLGVDGMDEMPAIDTAALTVTGGGIARLLEGSDTFGPRIRAGLEAIGIAPGSPQFAAYFVVAQQVIDSGDPINYAATAAASHPLHLIEVLGDAVIPNAVAGAPLSGTEPLARVMALTPVGASARDEDGLRTLARITEGSHASPLSPTDSLAAYAEIQSQFAGFLASDGTALPVTNPGVVAQP